MYIYIYSSKAHKQGTHYQNQTSSAALPSSREIMARMDHAWVENAMEQCRVSLAIFCYYIDYMGISIVMGLPPIAGWFIGENPIKMDVYYTIFYIYSII